MSVLKKLLIKISGNKFSQKLLHKRIKSSQFLMGIGSGSNVNYSGEKAIFDVLSNKCKTPYCIFDVGANKGQFLGLILRNLAGDDFDVHCFEPSATAFHSLKENSPEDERITLNNIGLGKAKSEMLLHYDNPGSGLASLTKRKLYHYDIDFSKSEKVLIDTVDNYCQEKGVKRINLLKIDVEGHELDVLAGASNMFNSKLVDIVTFEFGGCNIDTRSFFQDFYYFFQDVGMKISRITPSGYLYPIDSYKEICEQFRTTNFLATIES
ncbi:MAG: FkbM family methyltransferase [Pseudomonadota bacterium]